MICFLRLMFVLQLLQIDSVQVQVLQLIRWNRKYKILSRRPIQEVEETIFIFSWRRRRPNTQDPIDRKNVEIVHLVVPPPATPREPGELSVDWEKIFSLESESFLKVFFYQSGLWSLCSELKCQLDTIAPKKEVIARPCHWWTLLKTCHSFRNHNLEKGI